MMFASSHALAMTTLMIMLLIIGWIFYNCATNIKKYLVGDNQLNTKQNNKRKKIDASQVTRVNDLLNDLLNDSSNSFTHRRTAKTINPCACDLRNNPYYPDDPYTLTDNE